MATIDEERERRERLAAEHNLTVSEVEWAERMNEPVETYALMRGVRSVTEYELVRLELARRVEAREQAAKDVLIAAERKRLEAAENG